MGIRMVLSLWGYCFVLCRKGGVPFWCAPLVCASGISLALFGGALSGRLADMSGLVLAGGLLCFLYFSACAWRGKIRLPGWRAEAVCIGAGMEVFALLSLRLRLTHYDNFSHWALLVKYLLLTEELPQAGDALLAFRDYPPGMSLFLFYVCRYAGHSQGMMLLAQNSVILSCFLAMFGIVKERRRFLLYSFLGMGCAMLSYLNLTIRINNLLVDFLLPLLVLASVACAYREMDNRRLCAVQIPLLGFTGIVKGTGLFFAGVAGVYVVWRLFQNARGTGGKRGRRMAVCLPAALLMLAGAAAPALLWQRHVETDLAGFEGKFQAGAGTGAGEAARARLRPQIAEDFLRAVLDPADRAFQVIALAALLALAAALWSRLALRRRWKVGWVLWPALAAVAAYYGGMLYMYLFTMPEEEALRLAGFDRYACSAATLFAGLLLLCAVTDMEGSFAVDIDERGAYRAYSSPAAKRRYQYAVLATFLVGVNFLYSEYSGLLVIRSSYETSLPGRAQALVGDRWPAGGRVDPRRYLVVASDADGQVSSGEAGYVFRYFLWAEHVDVKETAEGTDGYDCVIVLDPEPALAPSLSGVVE